MFEQIKGQDKPIQLLKSCLRNGRLTGAYLFSGPEGTGKYSAAMILAQAVNCPDSADDACGRCASCVKIAGYSHPDVFVINMSVYFDPVNGRAVPPPQHRDAGEDNHRGKKEAVQGRDIKIDYIRALRDGINMRPYEGRKKVFIINDAHTLTRDAQDAFLKPLEEAVPDSLIILISDKPSLLAKTIISRCRTLKFGALRRDELENILSKEHSLEGPGVAHYFAYFSEGRMGYAARLAGKKSAFTEKNRVIDEFTGPAGLRESAFINRLEKAGREEILETIKILAAWFRDVYVLKAGAGRQEIINLDRKEDLERCASAYSFEELEGKLRCLSDSVFYLEHNLNVKLLLSTIRMELWKN
ncbi:MAG: DNA polymerase III subunit [Candidatus Omnitrophica bacterium]|nr:DNA polymerase III subunit [Candidatus Omnitrophota bacterium]